MGDTTTFYRRSLTNNVVGAMTNANWKHKYSPVEFRRVRWCQTHDTETPGGDNPDSRCWFSWRYEVRSTNGAILSGECVVVDKWLQA